MTAWQNAFSTVLDDSDLPPNLVEHRTAMLDLVRALRSELPTHFGDETSSPFREHLLADGSSTVTIMGERGSGKTTLLVSACGELLREGVDLVLPIMRPDLFSENESVISSFLASLWATLVDPVPSEARSTPIEGDTDFVRLLADTTRSHAAWRTTRAALAHATDSTVDFAEDAIAISRSGARLPSQIMQLARRLCLRRHDEPRLVIVPIDDPDLAPTMVGPILRDLRVLGSIPGIVPIASFCQADLASAWAEADESLSQRPRTRSLLRYEREMEKLFPYRFRFEIRSLTAADRIHFAPLGEKTPLDAQLTRLRELREREGVHWPIDRTLSLASLPFGLSNPLPSSPRTLVQIWSTLDQLTATSPGEETLELSLRHLCDLFSERLRAEMGLMAGDQFYEVGSRANGQRTGRYLMHVDLPSLQLRISSEGRYTPAVTGPDSVGSVALRPLSVVSAMRRVDSSSRSDGREPMSSAATSSLLAFQEIAYGSDLFDVSGNRLFVGLDEWVWLQRVTLGGLSTDDAFLLLPSATTLAEVLRAATLWNQLTAMAGTGLPLRDLLTAFVEASCAMLDDEEPALTGASTTYEEALLAARNRYLERVERDDWASRNFCAWYEQDLPLHWHGGFFGPDALRRFCQGHEETVASQGRDRGRAREVLDARIVRNLDAIHDDESRGKHCWIAGYFELAASIGSAHLDRLLPLHRLWRDRANALQTGARVAANFVTHAVGAQRMSPYVTPEGQDLLERARELLRRRLAASLKEFDRRRSHP